MPGNNVNRFPTQSSSPGGADLLGLLLFGTMSNLMGAAPRLPTPPRAPATNFTAQQVCLLYFVCAGNSRKRYVSGWIGGEGWKLGREHFVAYAVIHQYKSYSCIHVCADGWG